MTKILLLSDTHGYIDEKIIKYCKQVDEVWHAGDIGDINVTDQIQQYATLRCVYGNIDGAIHRNCFEKNLFFSCEQVPVYMTHIGGYPPNYNKSIKEKIREKKPKLFICGHSHILKVMYDKTLNCLHMNPGACGISGIHKVRTLLKFEIDGPNTQNLNVIEFPKNQLS